METADATSPSTELTQQWVNELVHEQVPFETSGLTRAGGVLLTDGCTDYKKYATKVRLTHTEC